MEDTRIDPPPDDWPICDCGRPADEDGLCDTCYQEREDSQEREERYDEPEENDQCPTEPSPPTPTKS